MPNDYKKLAKKNIKILFDILSRNGVKELEVGFSGHGDDGAMDILHFVFENVLENDDKIKYDALMEEPVPQVSDDELTLYNFIEQTCEFCLESEDVDWVNGDGNSGGVYFDVKNKKVMMTYQIKEEKTVVFE